MWTWTAIKHQIYKYSTNQLKDCLFPDRTCPKSTTAITALSQSNSASVDFDLTCSTAPWFLPADKSVSDSPEPDHKVFSCRDAHLSAGTGSKRSGLDNHRAVFRSLPSPHHHPSWLCLAAEGLSTLSGWRFVLLSAQERCPDWTRGPFTHSPICFALPVTS